MSQNINASNIIKFGNKVTELCYQFGRSVKLNSPIIKVVGSQSSGKSTWITKTIGYDILPAGENMVTRTPINVRLHQTDQNDVTLKLSYLDNNSSLNEVFSTKFIEGSKESFQVQKIFRTKVSELVDEITEATTKGYFNISRTPIFIDVESQNVINLSFVDLPGLIITAATDKGQPRDLKNQIDELIKHELSQENTIILVVIKSGNDLATDLGVGMINELKNTYPENKFCTIGLLTKPDLLNSKGLSDLNSIIAGRMPARHEPLSQSETMTEGYFTINNNTIGHQEEEKFFLEKFSQSDEVIANKKFGINNLKLVLQSHLVTAIINTMSTIEITLREILEQKKQKSSQLGYEMQTDSEKTRYVISVVSEVSRFITSAVRESGSSSFSVGPNIRTVQEIFLQKISTVKPFSSDKVSDSYLREIISKFNGYDMGSRATITQLVDSCIKDPNRRPVMLIKPIAEEFSQSVCDILVSLVNQILNSQTIASLQAYPKFKNKLANTIFEKIKEYKNNSNNLIATSLIIQESFLWSTADNFKESFHSHYLPKSNDDEKKQDKHNFIPTSAIKSTSNYKSLIDTTMQFQYSYEPYQIRDIAEKYYITIIESMRDFIVKIVISQIVQTLSLEINTQLHSLINNIGSDQSLLNLIVENPEIEIERKSIKNDINKLESALASISKLKN